MSTHSPRFLSWQKVKTVTEPNTKLTNTFESLGTVQQQSFIAIMLQITISATNYFWLTNHNHSIMASNQRKRPFRPLINSSRHTANFHHETIINMSASSSRSSPRLNKNKERYAFFAHISSSHKQCIWVKSPYQTTNGLIPQILQNHIQLDHPQQTIHHPNPGNYSLSNTLSDSVPGINQIQQKIHHTPLRLAHKVGRRKDGWVRVTDPLNNPTPGILDNPVDPVNTTDESTAAATSPTISSGTQERGCNFWPRLLVSKSMRYWRNLLP